MFATTAVSLEISSNLSSGKSMPSRPATAFRWMIAFVEPPIAMSTRTAFSSAFRVITCEGLRPSRTISTILSPLRCAIS